MGPLSGIGDTFFWGIIRILACALAIGFAKEGNPIDTVYSAAGIQHSECADPSDHTGSWIQQRCTDLKRDGEDR